MKYQLITLLLLLSVFTPGSKAHAFFNVHLKNGEVLQTEDFSIDKDKITLIYKIGSASFPRSMVDSIMDEAGDTDFLATQGDAVIHAPEKKPTGPGADHGEISNGSQLTPVSDDKAAPRLELMGIARPASAEGDAAAAYPANDNAQPSDPDDPSFYDGMNPDDAAFLRGDIDINDVENNGGTFSPSSH